MRRLSLLIVLLALAMPALAQHSYWRVVTLGDGDGSYTSCEILEFHATVGGPNVAIGGTPLESGHYDGSTYNASACFDGSTSTEWISASGLPQWIGYQFLTAVTVVEFKWTPQSANPNRGPSKFNVDFSDDGVTWTTSWNFSGSPSWTTAPMTFTEPQLLSVSKAIGFGVTVPAGLSVSKGQAYATTVPPGLSVSKALVYVVVAPVPPQKIGIPPPIMWFVKPDDFYDWLELIEQKR